MNIKYKIKTIIYDKYPLGRRHFPYMGTKVYFPKGSYLFYRACENEIYEQETVRILCQLIKRNSFFFDVGANIGLLSIPILKYTLCNCVSFEPSPNSLPFLQLTAKDSSMSNRWTIIGKAVGPKIGEVDFHMSSEKFGAFDGLKNTDRFPVEKVVKVPVTTIDHEWTLLGKPLVSAIKIDVEGAEIEVLQGAKDCIKKEKPYIFTEWNSINLRAYGRPIGDLIKISKEIGYEVYTIPNIVKVNNESELSVQMLFSENFLLCPIAN